MWNSTGNHDSPLNHSLLRGQARIADNRTARSPRRPRPYRAEQHPVASQSSRERSCTRSWRSTVRIRSGLAALNSAGTGIMLPVSQPDSRHLPAPIIGRKHFKGNHFEFATRESPILSSALLGDFCHVPRKKSPEETACENGLRISLFPSTSNHAHPADFESPRQAIPRWTA